MQTTLELYTYEIITKEQTDLIEKAAECLARTFIGVEVAGKWVQEPMVGQLNLGYEDFYQFTKDYLDSTVDQGYCVVAKDAQNNVVGVLAGDTNAPEIIGEDIFEGSFSNMNVILHVLEDVDKRFMEDYQKRNGKEIEDGELLHLFMIGVIAEHGRHEIIQELGNSLITKAKSQGLKAVLVEATNPKSVRIFDKYHNIQKYKDLEGNYIVHKYQENSKLNGIPENVADGTYILLKEL
ncbi:hypothetical protein AN964_18210 [Heyndrickxia shackletonii]|uniref:N-acetyltransferase domain-containing protein n=1 Tax=Heyndrickxia shackletonii TaxID=157838 RepID=A0A0Q3TMN3_9BACI|nr:hypothetical protein [Heyndrickxia shackletonii]KQL55254.1 hypothetical protein AN964_18210 [Heyndrickxia shackletonii]MBB2482741.1 hypothetical protein [Bacillus sp. APMAM]NEY98780.1 hypothetical protein [Heyndrickxia shackletonii]RTZ53836.1 hypothetical protein EKO25_21230 [Bacillus sp. SAJ1]